MRLRVSLGSSGFHPQTACGPSSSPMRALQVGRIADQPLARHAAAPLRCGRGARLASPLQTEGDQPSAVNCQGMTACMGPQDTGPAEGQARREGDVHAEAQHHRRETRVGPAPRPSQRGEVSRASAGRPHESGPPAPGRRPLRARGSNQDSPHPEAPAPWPVDLVLTHLFSRIDISPAGGSSVGRPPIRDQERVTCSRARLILAGHNNL